MIINMGPQHPSTHGVLRLMLELRARPCCGPSRSSATCTPGMEKTGEDLTYLQGPTNVTRMDYAAPLFNELAFSMAAEAAPRGRAPARATWIRMLMCRAEPDGQPPAVPRHQRHGPRRRLDDALRLAEREEVLRFFEKVTGLRMNHNYIRPGGVAADLPDGWQEDVPRLLDVIPPGSTSTTT